MIAEAEKYLGYPYVWGGSNPNTSFDCSGFVCWVVNHTEGLANVGRTTANGLRSLTTAVSPDSAQPGGFGVFQGYLRQCAAGSQPRGYLCGQWYDDTLRFSYQLRRHY